MRWLFWKRKTPTRDLLFDPIVLAPSVAVAEHKPPTKPPRPEPVRPPGSLGRAWSPEAPEDWREAEMADFDRQNRECHERARCYRASENWPPGGISAMANVFPRVGAVRRDLIALAEALESWRQRHGEEVVGISGLENLKRGLYPHMEIYIDYMNDRTMYAPGWKICPVLVSTQGELFDLRTLIACLEDELPDSLFSHIGAIFPD